MDTLNTPKYIEIFEKLGLNKNEAQIYELLLNSGTLGVKPILFQTHLKRGNAYYHLDNLKAKGLVETSTERGKTLFSAKHPEQLELLLAQQKTALLETEERLSKTLPELRSLFQLITTKPGVKFYEGLEGVKKVLEDTLTDNPQKELLVFSDAAGYSTYLLDWNTKFYAPKRRHLKITEKVIIPNTPKALEWLKGYQPGGVTDFLFIDQKLFPFSTETNIYNNKVSFVTFSPKGHVAVLIENKEIHDTLKSIFTFTWDMGKKYGKDWQPAWVKQQPPASLPPYSA